MYTFDELRNKYTSFIYKDFSVNRVNNVYYVTYHFSIDSLYDFESRWSFPTKVDVNEDILNRLIFNLGMVESISYWKCTCSRDFIIKCGTLSKYQIGWWKKLFYNGLGEFMYRNNIDIDRESLVNIMCEEELVKPIKDTNRHTGCLVPIGGGKDSIVSLELLKGDDIATYSVNGNSTVNNVVELCDYKQYHYSAERMLDSGIIDLNRRGYLNGHIPFSAVVAFSSYISAYLCGKKYIALSNESSANESTVKGSFVNHQYSKSFEFEKDFMNFIRSIVDSDILYFSLLRPLSEIQIAYIFSKQDKYRSVFRSCNSGSKKGIWCCSCPKCLFVYIILIPFLGIEELQNIFGDNLLDKSSMEDYFKELIGIKENKPFECVGTRKEVLVSLKAYLDNGGRSLLTDKYSDFIRRESGTINEMLTQWTSDNNVPDMYVKRIKEQLCI